MRYAHRYADPADRETAGLLSSAFAFGVVKAVLGSLDLLFSRLGPSPSAAVASLDARGSRAVARGFRHRWVGEADLAAFLLACGRVLRRFGAFEAAFAAGDDRAAPTTEPGLRAFARTFAEAAGPARGRALKFLVPSPGGGSACKRMNLFLRWMARPADGLDLGVWTSVAPARLLIPLDVHVHFHALVLGLTRRRAPDWRAAIETTAALRALAPDDPLRYDFALFRLGVDGECRGRRDPGICPRCPLDAVCLLPKRRLA